MEAEKPTLRDYQIKQPSTDGLLTTANSPNDASEIIKAADM